MGVGFALAVRNTGNVTLSLDGAVLVDSGGRPLRLALAPGDLNVIPGGQATLLAGWARPPTLGLATAHAVLAARVEGSPTRSYSSGSLSLTFFPWRLAEGLATMLGLVMLGGYAGRHRLQRVWRNWRADRAVLAQARAQRREAAARGEQ